MKKIKFKDIEGKEQIISVNDDFEVLSEEEPKSVFKRVDNKRYFTWNFQTKSSILLEECIDANTSFDRACYKNKAYINNKQATEYFLESFLLFLDMYKYKQEVLKDFIKLDWTNGSQYKYFISIGLQNFKIEISVNWLQFSPNIVYFSTRENAEKAGEYFKNRIFALRERENSF